MRWSGDAGANPYAGKLNTFWSIWASKLPVKVDYVGQLMTAARTSQQTLQRGARLSMMARPADIQGYQQVVVDMPLDDSMPTIREVGETDRQTGTDRHTYGEREGCKACCIQPVWCYRVLLNPRVRLGDVLFPDCCFATASHHHHHHSLTQSHCRLATGTSSTTRTTKFGPATCTRPWSAQHPTGSGSAPMAPSWQTSTRAPKAHLHGSLCLWGICQVPLLALAPNQLD